MRRSRNTWTLMSRHSKSNQKLKPSRVHRQLLRSPTLRAATTNSFQTNGSSIGIGGRLFASPLARRLAAEKVLT